VSLLDLIRSKPLQLSEVERAMINSLLMACRPDIRSAIEKQLGSYNTVIRYGTEVVIGRYFFGKGRPVKALRIPVKVDDFEFGKTTFTCDGKKLSCSFMIVKGFLGILQFSGPVRSSAVQLIQTTVNQEFFGQPDPTSVRVTSVVPIESVPLLKQYSELGLTRAFAPLPADGIALHYKRLRECLPDDYVELIRQAEGFEFRAGMVYGISQAFVAQRDDGDHVTLAEVFGFGQIGCRYRGKVVEVFVLESEDLEVKRSDKNFRDTLIEFLRKSK